jgi:hypothetical protein
MRRVRQAPVNPDARFAADPSRDARFLFAFTLAAALLAAVVVVIFLIFR